MMLKLHVDFIYGVSGNDANWVAGSFVDDVNWVTGSQPQEEIGADMGK
jgi:hypothetical protein